MASCLLSQQLQDKARETLMKGLCLWLPSCRGKEGRIEEIEEGKGEASLSEKEVMCGYTRNLRAIG